MPEFAVKKLEDDAANKPDLSEKIGSNPCGEPFCKNEKCNFQNCTMDCSKMNNLYQI